MVYQSKKGAFNCKFQEIFLVFNSPCSITSGGGICVNETVATRLLKYRLKNKPLPFGYVLFPCRKIKPTTRLLYVQMPCCILVDGSTSPLSSLWSGVLSTVQLQDFYFAQIWN